MPAKRKWTEAENAEIHHLIGNGASTTQLGRRYGCCRQSVLEHAKEIGAMGPRTWKKEPTFNRRTETHTVVAYPRDIWPLPPGHDVTWQAITQGTCLEGSSYG